MVVYFITDGSPGLIDLACSLEPCLAGICELRHMQLEEAARADLPQAMVLPYRAGYACNADFQKLGERVADRFGLEDALDRRVYIVPADLSEEDFLQILESGEDRALSLMGDVIQIEAGRSMGSLARDIKVFIAGWELDRTIRIREKRRHQRQFLTGWLAEILMDLGELYILARAILEHIVKPLPFITVPDLPILSFGQEILLPLVWFMGGIKFLTILIGILQKGIEGVVNDYERMVSYPLDSVLFMLHLWTGMSGPILLYFSGIRNWYLVPVGFVLSLALDILRRERFIGIRFRRFQALDKSMSTGTDKEMLAGWLRDSGRRPITNTLRCPYVKKGRIRVFVSYTHASAWARDRVDELVSLCRQADIECFVDKEGIPRGTSWRRSIFTGLLVADYFIAFSDEISVRKQWPAAELEMALALRAISGCPQPIVFVPPDFPCRVSKDYLPVFRDTMLCSSEPDFFVRVIWYSQEAMKTLVMKSIAKKEARTTSALLDRSYPGAAADKAKAREAEIHYRKINHLRRTMTAKMIGAGGSGNPIIDERFGICRYPMGDDRRFLLEVTRAAEDAHRDLMPQRDYLMNMEALDLAVIMGEADLAAFLAERIIGTLFGSRLSDFSLYLELHKIEYTAAYAFAAAGDYQKAVLYADRCIQGIESIGMLRMYFFKGFNLEKDVSLFSHGVTVLPLSFKFMSDENFEDILSRARRVRDRASVGLGPG